MTQLELKTTAVEPRESGITITPLAMIDKAIASGAGVEILERLMALQERYEANMARKAFVEGLALAKAKFRQIIKKHSGYGNRYKYEKLDDVMDAVDAALQEHGFTYSWEADSLEDGRVKVTCVLTHEAGHSRQTNLMERPDTVADPKANMNSAQRLLACVTYLQRGTLKAILGVAASEDTDGRTSLIEGSATITADEYQTIVSLIEETGAVEGKVLAAVNASTLEDMTQKQYREALSRLQAWKKNKAKGAE